MLPQRKNCSVAEKEDDRESSVLVCLLWKAPDDLCLFMEQSLKLEATYLCSAVTICPFPDTITVYSELLRMPHALPDRSVASLLR